jgi:hypothetical protein
MTEIVVFVGPTIPVAEARSLLEATFLPPAQQGDVYRTALRGPRAIAIIDGTFEAGPAVWHKEILWALSQGIHVFGASSMGALRAAELADFGMQGVGEIYCAFREGRLEDDDEVAVAHQDAGTQFRSVSEAMVNIRATLRAAARAGALDAYSAEKLEQIAKSTFYAERSYPALLSAGRAAGLGAARLASLAAFVERQRIDQKRLDARALLDQLRVADLSEPVRVPWHFERTEAWDLFLLDSETAGGSGEASLLLEEVRLHPQILPLVRRGALLRALAEAEARRSGRQTSQEMLDDAEARFRAPRQLFSADSMSAWLGDEDLTLKRFRQFLKSDVELDWLDTLHRDDAVRHVPAELLTAGVYEVVRARVVEKDRTLRARGLEDPGLGDAKLEFHDLVRWFFEERLGCAVPDNLHGYLRDAGLSGPEQFVREAVREFLFAGIERKPK